MTIIKLPPHTSHLLQPLDLAVIGPFNTAWDQELVKWQRQNKATKLPKKGGIYPFDCNAIPKSKFDKAALQRWEAKEDELRKAENERTEVIHEDRQNTERQDSVSGDLTVCLMDVDELDASRE